MRTVFLRLPDGSFTELKLKLELAQHFGGYTEHVFFKSECRMMLKDLSEELIGIYQEKRGDSSSRQLINFLEKHPLRIHKNNIVGIVHPSNWSIKTGSRLYTDIRIVEDLSSEFGIPLLGAG